MILKLICLYCEVFVPECIQPALIPITWIIITLYSINFQVHVKVQRAGAAGERSEQSPQ